MYAFSWYNKDIIAIEGSKFEGFGDVKSLSKQTIIVHLSPP